VLIDVMKNADSDTYILSGACAPEAQDKLFKKVMRLTGFPAERFFAVDIRTTDNEGIMKRLREKVEAILLAASPKNSEAEPRPVSSNSTIQGTEASPSGGAHARA
jgi:hypothetical protein